ncbi:hypothetical protein ACXR2W_11925 [Leucobacter sp. HY1908]
MQDFIAWVSGVAVLIGFALSMGTHPATYGATTDMLARKTRWLPRLCFMSAGLMVGATLLFTLFQFINPDSFVHRVEGALDRSIHNHSVDVFVGVSCLAAAAGVLVWRYVQPVLPFKPAKESAPKSHLLSYFVIGLSSAIVGFTTLPVMYLTGQVVTKLSPHLVPRAVAYGIFLFFLVAPFFAIAIIWTRMPSLAIKISAIYQRLLRWDYRILVAVILALAGIAALAFAHFAHR